MDKHYFSPRMDLFLLSLLSSAFAYTEVWWFWCKKLLSGKSLSEAIVHWLIAEPKQQEVKANEQTTPLCHRYRISNKQVHQTATHGV